MLIGEAEQPVASTTVDRGRTSASTTVTATYRRLAPADALRRMAPGHRRTDLGAPATRRGSFCGPGTATTNCGAGRREGTGRSVTNSYRNGWVTKEECS